jgi:hypothetical protein
MIPLRSIPTLAIALAALAAAAWFQTVSSRQSGLFADAGRPSVHAHHQVHAAAY